jgi:glycogen(starch) synthase
VKLMYWAEQFWPTIGGVQVRSLMLLRALLQRGYQVCVVTSSGTLDLPTVDTYQGIAIHRFPFEILYAQPSPAAVVRLGRSIGQLLRAFQPDVVDIQFSGPSAFFHLQTREIHPAPFLLTVCVAPSTSVAGSDTLLGQLIQLASWITAPAMAPLQEVHALAPGSAARSSVISNALEEPPMPPTPLPFDAPRILCLGRVVQEKGFDVAVDAWAAIQSQFPSARLLIAGDGPARPHLECQARSLGIASRVDFLGWVSPEDVPALINSVTMVVMPSRWQEAFGLVALQAAQLARPVVASRVGGLVEVVADGETGILVAADDAPALAAALASLLADPERARHFGRNGRNRARALFGWDHYVDAHDRLYRTLAQSTS